MKNLTLGDRVVLAVSPDLAAKRIMRRLQIEQMMNLDASAQGGASHGNRSETRWRGASQTLRSMAGWITTLGSGRTDLTKAERERMAARSYDAYRNHMIGRAVITRCRTNIVGTGLSMHPDVDAEALGISEEEAEELNEQIAREWCLYYDNPAEVDIEATHDGAGLQALALVSAMLGGDCWGLTPYEERAGGIYGLKMQLIDGARVSNKDGMPDTTFLQDGVHISATGAPLAIDIRNRHPADRTYSSEADRWDTRAIFGPSGERRIFQIWNDKDRIGMTRGAPFLAPILEPLQQLEQYSRAELMAAVISALVTVFIQKDAQQVDERGNPLPAIQGQTVKGSASDISLGNGVIVDLAPGEKPIAPDLGRPNAKFDPFFMAIVRQIGATTEIPVDELLLSYQSSYSAARAAMLQAWRFYVMRRWWLVQQFCQPHYTLWFDEAVALGRIKVSNYSDPARRRAYTQSIWIGPARGAMDETQEANAAKTRIEAGLSNETIETAAMMGENWRTVYRQRNRELKRRRLDGNVLGPAPGQAAQPTGQPGKTLPDPTAPKTPTDPTALPEDSDDLPEEGEDE